MTTAEWDLVLVDFALAPDSSLGVLEAMKHARPSTLVAMAGSGIDARTVRLAFRRGAYDVLTAFEKQLSLEKGGSNRDFSLVEEECIAACANAPAVLCGTKYFLDVEASKVPEIVSELRRNPTPESEVV